MKIGISTYAFRWAIGTDSFRPDQPMTVLDFMKRAHREGAEVVQICDNLPLHGMSEEELDHIAQAAKDFKLDIELGIRGATPEHLRQYLEIGARLGAELLRIVRTDGTWKPTLNEIEHLFRDFQQKLRSAQITAAIENHHQLSPADLAQLMQRLDDPHVRICLDTLNSMSRFVGPAETVSLLSPFAVSMHVKDATISRLNTGFYLAGCPLGEGLADIPSLLKMVTKLGTVSSIHVESWMDRLPDPEETLAQEERWVRHDLKFIKAQIDT